MTERRANGDVFLLRVKEAEIVATSCGPGIILIKAARPEKLTDIIGSYKRK